MAEFVEGVAGAEGVDDSVSTEVGAVDTGVAEGVDAVVSDDPWAWAQEEGVDPTVVRDSFKNYTKKTQELAARSKALQPYEELANAVQTDAGLQAIIRQYYENGQTPEVAIGNLEQELRTMQTRLALDEEFKALDAFVAKNGTPPFERDEVLDYAVENNIGSMDAAYKAMTYDARANAARESLENDIKNGQRAATPKSGRGDSAAVGNRPSTEDIAAMTDDDFVSGFGDVLKRFTGRA